MEFTKQEMTEIYYMAVDELESLYIGDLDDIDVAKAAITKFGIEAVEKIRSLQSLILKTETAIPTPNPSFNPT